MMPSRGLVFDCKRFATHDGSGIRTTVFMKGCPLRCAWCQNPEGLNAVPQVLYMEKNCIHCGSCMQACRNNGITMTAGQIQVHRSQPENWKQVTDACPSRALRMDSTYYTVDELMAEIRKDQPFFAYGGGVTFSGGEPLLQAPFVAEVLKQCQKEGIHTCIETSLYADRQTLDLVLPYLDEVYCDCKVYEDNEHFAYTHVHNDQILANLRYLLNSEKREHVVVRTPLIPEMTATDENIRGIASFLAAIDPEVHYELLNYNPLAASKYSYLDMEYCFDDNPKMYSAEKMEHFRQIAVNAGIKNIVIS
ncbi:glycyl-radical enzyme activating protein [Catenisphaera adipataccumulans]|jgi:pyruvate formate lyase activating enzyme|uniref:Pyruvate formate lyase activating enzyme n=1 Tax=Catenisphaera adipataccumulans TaxID=700500 RepID=A0A7W8CXM0_9FIRM|nr:glycyl-radical enzyme activating protein [Catenisphaera adipataccumulans]MBB5182804.1 pyruvate formate lyase activating enzyme [Catenisphaera adipataccumulans]